MKTIFAVGLFPDKNRTLVKHLCRNFKVIMFRNLHFLSSKGYDVEFLEDIVENDPRLSLDIFERDINHCTRFIIKQISTMLCSDESLLPDADLTAFRNMALRAASMSNAFRNLTEHVNIDLVVSNSDSSGLRRPVVIEAKRLGIPTMNIEHGFWGVLPEPDCYKSAYRPLLSFISDYINLDNQIEKRFWEMYHKTTAAKQPVTFVINGTPNDITCIENPLREEGLQFLNLQKDKFTITIIGSWNVALVPSAALDGLIEEVESYKNILRGLANCPERNKLQIIVKLHPSFGVGSWGPQVLCDVKRYLQKLSHTVGIEIALITHEHLDQILAATDLILSYSGSSVLWESFMASVPGIIYPTPGFLSKVHKDKLNEGNLLCRRGCLKYVFNQRELIDSIKYYMQPSNYDRFRIAAKRIRDEMQIGYDSADVKSERICDFIHNTIDKKAPFSPADETVRQSCTSNKIKKHSHSISETARSGCYYGFSRPEVQSLVNSSSKKILDIGCASGKLGYELKTELEAEVWGIEINVEIAKRAENRLDKVICGDIEDVMAQLPDAYFDTIIFADVLEHLVNPYSILEKIKTKLSETGDIIASIPNVRHWSVLKDLIEGRWNYSDAGILDRTHLRFFTKSSVIEMFKTAGYRIDKMQGTVLEGYDVPKALIKALSSVPINADSLAEEGRIYQHLVLAKPDEAVCAKIVNPDLTSIIILAHNQLEFTKKCVESIFKYTNAPFELIVVDNGSTDGTVQYLENLKCRYGANYTDHQIEASKPKGRKKKKGKKKKYKKIVALDKFCTDVKVIRNKKNLGFAAGNNQGMAAVKGDYILLMNNDVVVTPGWLSRMISCAERNPKIGIVGPMSNYVIGPQLVKEVSYNTASLARLNKYAKKFAENNTDQAKLILRVVGFCMLIKRAVIDKIGGMDDRYGLGNFEDDDFSLRATLAGFESWIAEDCFVHHFGSRTFIGAKIDYNESLRKNWEIFKIKWGMPQELPYGSPYNISHIPNDGFDPAKHYCPLSRNDTLPEKPDIISESPVEIYGRIQPILASGQHEKAIITLEKLLESYPDFALAHNDLGVLYFNKREKEKALNHYEKAAQLEPNNITFHKNLSDFHYVELGRLEEALQGYVHVLSINPKDVETLLIVGHICVALHKLDDAKVFYSRVLEIEPENVDARQNLDKLVSGQVPVVIGQPEQDSVALKPVSFLTNQGNDKKYENMESQQEASSKNIHTSIIIPALNQQKHIKKCVKSIQEYTSEPYEILFVTKGAKSSTLKWLRSVVKENENYHLVELEKDADFAIAYNKGIKTSSGEYIVLLHSDVVVTEGWLSGLLECINSAPDAGIVGPMTNNASGVQKVSDSDDITLDHLEEFAKSFREKNRYCSVPSRELSEFCLLFKRELVEKIGPFDVSLGQNNLEVDDICLRATLEGYRNIIAGDVFAYKYDGPELIGNKKSFTEKWDGIDAQSLLGKKLLALNAMEKSVDLDEKGQIDDAVRILVQGTAHVPDDKRLYHALTEMLINNKQFKDALEALNELPSDDQDVKKLELAGYCMEGMEQYKEAEEYADHALSLHAASALALNLKGVLAYRQGDNSMAEDFFNRTISSDPGFGEPYTNLGALKWAMGDQEEALDLYERGFILSPTIMDIVTIYHSAVTDLGAFERAEPVFRDAITLHPQNRRLKYLSIDILIKQGKHDLAMEEIEGAMIAFGIDDGLLSAALKVREALGPEKIDEKSNRKNTISLCMIVKNEEQHLAKCLKSTKPVVDEMIVVDTGSTDMTRDIARVFGARVYDIEWRDDFSEARNYSISKASGKWILVMDADEVISPRDYVPLRKLFKKSTSRSVAYSFVTRNYSTRANTIGWTVNDGKYGTEEAGSGWMPSTKVRLFHNVSHIRFEYPVHEKVEPALKRSGIEIKKCNTPVHHYGQLNEKKFDLKGEAYYDMGRKKLEKLGDDVVAIRELAVQAGGLGKHDEAIELWQRLVAINPDMPVAYVNMGTAYLKLGKYEDALLSAKKAVEFAPNMKEALNNYALCQLYLGNVRQAIPVLEKLMEQEPEYLSAQFVLAAAYCCDGKMKMGLKTFEKLRHTITGPGLAVACHDLAKKLVSAQRLEYAIALLEAAIKGGYVNKEVLSLLSECRRTEQESMNHIDSASIFPIESKDAQPCLKNASLY